MRGYLVQPSGTGPFPVVLVIHENRGLNPYIEDVARRAAVAGFLALAPDGLFPVGGYPGNDDDGRALQAKLDQGKLRTDMLNSARYLKAHALSSGRLGVTGFCWGGSTTNALAGLLGRRCRLVPPSTAPPRTRPWCPGSRPPCWCITPSMTSASPACGRPMSRR
ncbi:dienelactone hydrolase family protein [Pseudoroseomonas wenyumeiae]